MRLKQSERSRISALQRQANRVAREVLRELRTLAIDGPTGRARRPAAFVLRGGAQIGCPLHAGGVRATHSCCVMHDCACAASGVRIEWTTGRMSATLPTEPSVCMTARREYVAVGPGGVGDAAGGIYQWPSWRSSVLHRLSSQSRIGSASPRGPFSTGAEAATFRSVAIALRGLRRAGTVWRISSSIACPGDSGRPRQAGPYAVGGEDDQPHRQWRDAGAPAERVRSASTRLAVGPVPDRQRRRRAGLYQAAIDVCRALIEVGDLDGAEVALTEVVQAVPDNLAAVRGLADICNRRALQASHLAPATGSAPVTRGTRAKRDEGPAATAPANAAHVRCGHPKRRPRSTRPRNNPPAKPGGLPRLLQESLARAVCREEMGV